MCVCVCVCLCVYNEQFVGIRLIQLITHVIFHLNYHVTCMRIYFSVNLIRPICD